MAVVRGTAVQPRRARVQLYSSEPTRVHWRLLSGNRRDIGRSAVGYPDPESCVLALKHLLHRLPESRSRVDRVSLASWAWTVRLDDEPVATASHPFPRMVRCTEGLQLFLAALESADMSARVVQCPQALREGTT